MKIFYILFVFAMMGRLMAFSQNSGKLPHQVAGSFDWESGSGSINYLNGDTGVNTKTKADSGSALRYIELPEVWFPFDGDFLDYSGNNYHGTNMNASWTTDRYGNPGKALSFNGSNSGVRLDNGYPPVFNGSLTFSCWVYFNDDSRGILFGSYDTDHNVNFEKYTDFKLRIYWNNGERNLLTASNVVSANEWYFLTFIRWGDDMFEIYVNGQNVATFQDGGSNITPAGPFYIGRDSRTGSTVVNGKMDDVRIYGRALSDTEVLELYNETDLVADFTADETSGATPLTVNFTDASVLNLAPIAEWKWYFGDGDSSSVQNPVHIYENAGDDVQTCTVTLKVKDENGFVSEKTKEDYIHVFPANYFPGGNVNGVWTAANSPYFVGDEIIVPFGDTLTIEPGVCVKFRTNSTDYLVQEPTPDNSDFGYMTVYGTLIARGTEADTIVFTKAGNTGWWGMIHLTNEANPENPFEYCKMEYASYMIIDPENDKEIAGLSFDGMDGTVQNSSFFKNVYAIRCDSSDVIITQNTFYDQDVNDIVLGPGSASQISFNSFDGDSYYAIDGSNGEGCEPVIDHNTFAYYYHYGIYLDHAIGATISDNTIENCYGEGISINNSTAIIDSNMISGNNSGIILSNSNAEIKNCSIQNNTEHGIKCAYDTTIISGNTISGNGASGIYNSYSFSTVNENQILNNVSNGIYCEYSDSMNIAANTISGNDNNGIRGLLCSHTQIGNNTISSNNANGIYNFGSTSVISENTILSNGSSGIYCISDTSLIINNTISDHIYVDNSVGIYCKNSLSTVTQNQISENYIGIVCDISSPQIDHNIISSNTIGIYCSEYGDSKTFNNTLVDNGYGVACQGGADITIGNSILWDNEYGSLYGYGITITYSCIQGGYAGTGNIISDPKFANAANGDYNLTWTNFPINDATKSPCIDTGDPDLNGNGNDWLTDPDDRDPDQSRMDMGALHYHQTPRFTLLNPNGNHNAWEFPDVEIPGTSAPATFTVENKVACFNDCPVFFDGAGGHGDQFKIVNNGNYLPDTLLHLEPSQTAPVVIVFQPTEIGIKTSYLTAGYAAQYTDKVWVQGKAIGTGTVQGYVFTPTGEGVQDVTMTATKNTPPNPSFATTTDSSGFYFLSNIGYGTFTVQPSKIEGGVSHNFIPVSRSVYLPNNTPVTLDPFTDESYFNVAGNVSYQNTNCPVGDRYIYLDDELVTFTDSAGNYALEASIGTHTFRPDTAGGHCFIPSSYTALILHADSGINFVDKFTYSLSGYVTGGCGILLADSIGLKVECVNDCGFNDTIYTDASGFYSIDLAPFSYNITPVPFYYYGEPVIFGTAQVDVSKQDTIRDFTYHSDPVIEIKGFDTLTNQYGWIVLEQFEIYAIEIDVYEPYGAFGDIKCRIDTGNIIITDLLSDLEQDTIISISDSVTFYTFQAGYPNIYSGGQHPYQKVIKAKYENDTKTVALDDEWVYIIGQKPRETAFATTTPEIPLLILRDPPGDQSYSKFSTETEYSRAISFGLEKEGSLNVFSKTTTCLKFKLKFLFGVKLDAEVNTEFKYGATVKIKQNSVTENKFTFKMSETFQTDDGGDVVGPGADLYMGGAMNLLYGITDVLTISGDTVKITQDIIIAPNGFETTYLYPEYHILNTVIPSLYLIQDTVSARRWESFIALNDSLKSVAAGPTENWTLSALANYDKTKSCTVSRTKTQTFDLTVAAEVAYEAGLKIKNVTSGGGVTISAALTAGSSEITSNSYTTEIGYHLGDGDVGDDFTVDVATDPVYGTPVFTTISGRTSCPWEENTVPRQGCELSQPDPMWNVPASEAAEFLLDMTNTGQTDEAYVYGLRLLNETNTNGAIVEANSVQLGLLPVYFNLLPNSTLTIPIKISRPSGQIYDFEGITLRLASECEAAIGANLGVVPNLSDDAIFEVHFAPLCSPLSITSPGNNWVVNQANNNILPVTITDYELINPELVSVGLEYKLGNYWIEIFSIPKEEIQSLILDVDLDVSGLLDGPQKLRAVVECEGNVKNYTGVVNGVIDRTAPLVSGNPLPDDGVLSIGDETSFTFNEKLNPSSVNINTCRLLDEETGLIVGSGVEYKQATKKIVFTINPGLGYFIENHYLTAKIFGIKDEYSNPLADTARLTFMVDQGPLHWNPDNFVFTINEGDSLDFTAMLNNASSDEIFYWLTLPEWITAIPDTGTLSGTSGFKNIGISSNILQGGIYYDTIYANTVGYPAEELHIMIQTAGGPELAVNPSGQEVLAPSGTTTFAVTSNTDWTVIEETDWLSVDPYEGNGNGTLTVNFGENNSGSIRVGEISVTAADGLLVAIVTVTQQTWFIHTINLPSGWSGLSSYIMPYDTDIDNIFGSILDKLVIAITQESMYYPANDINTIVNWVSHSAYKVKTNAAVSLNILSNASEEDKTLLLDNGWNLIPVVSACPVDVESLFAPVVNDLIIVKEVAGYGVYWPGMGINSLDTLNPGAAYYVQMANSTTISYRECEKSSALSSPKNGFKQNPVWNPVVTTTVNHVIGIRGRAMLDFEPGDYIGVFTSKGICAGQILINDLHRAGALVAFGNDAWAKHKQGFDPGEAFTFKNYNASTGEENILIPEFDLSQSGGGALFIENGISIVTGFNVAETGLTKDFDHGITLFPNPTTGKFIIQGVDDDAFVDVFDIHLQLIKSEISKTKQGTEIDLTGCQPGIYIVRILSKGQYSYKKLILN